MHEPVNTSNGFRPEMSETFDNGLASGLTRANQEEPLPAGTTRTDPEMVGAAAYAERSGSQGARCRRPERFFCARRNGQAGLCRNDEESRDANFVLALYLSSLAK
jgi:hypothetical protein